MSRQTNARRKRRLDEELVEQGLFATKDDALRSVLAGEVSTSDRRLERPGELVNPGIFLHVRGRTPYVSRGGLKLERGIAAFGVQVEGRDCLDVGCSTGGFTDCLLRHGAATVLAVDVGYAQFDWSLRQDSRVTLLERTNMRDVPDLVQGRRVQLAVCDVSFTSVLALLPAICAMLEPGGQFLTLVKPQFEAPREAVGTRGVVHDASVREAALAHVTQGMIQAGFKILGSCESPIRGRRGNEEFLLLGQLQGATTTRALRP